ncbi:HAD-IIB family hydrolase [Oenococcus kitaharae]|uniref:Hydrolase (HAD superfamily) n=1 Tax=Oenococcus kitaharae DSM 17330 TaxID=1045004 RepID=G9WH98_9LACO|nr:HAD family hydrolase [Oenococcus kitaharae]EHN59664.1 Hydrolase (HAD superfamily) [Oenococcus kitaharae DSM 17330]OEY83504.1 HAD family hydrolase [Oenococcus kitaharae]OEY85303.1 HAD family hydrolase [Oenococcus kitaharae]OEY86157.1 HAD family hydrolase [Oenococcus kitaharae]
MNLKIIASDMDGTFLSDDKNYDIDRFCEQLDEMQKRDIKFVAASGNKFSHLRSIFQPILERGYQINYVSSNGAASYDQDTLVHAAFLSDDQIQKVITWNAENPDSEGNFVILTGLYRSYVSNHATPELIKTISEWYHDIKQIDKLMEAGEKILEVTFLWQNADVVKQVRRLRQVFGDEVHSTGSGFGNVDVLAANTNKATGLRYLQQRWGVSDDQVVAFGDNENDLEMLKNYPAGYLMTNADPSMHRKINLKTDLDNNHDGVLDMIDKLLLAN